MCHNIYRKNDVNHDDDDDDECWVWMWVSERERETKRKRNFTDSKRFVSAKKLDRVSVISMSQYIYIERMIWWMNVCILEEMWERCVREVERTFSKRTSLCLNRNFIRIFLPLSLSSITLSNNESCNSLWTFLLSQDVSFTTTSDMMTDVYTMYRYFVKKNSNFEFCVRQSRVW